MSDGDFAGEDEVGGAGEGDVLECLVAGLFEPDFQSLATFDIDSDWRAGSIEKVMDECACGHAGATGEGFSLDTTFVGADGDVLRADDFGEIGIRSVRCEVIVVTNGSSIL